MSISAVILAAGRGRRMGAEENKIFLPLCGEVLLTRTVVALASCPRIAELVIVACPGEEGRVATAVPSDLAQRVRIVPGGILRRDSAEAGIRCAEGELLLIHDAARPLVDLPLIERVIDAVHSVGAAVPAVPVVDTLRRWREDREGLDPTPVDRDRLVSIQTPQGFRSDLIRSSYAKATPGPLLDDAAAVYAAGYPVAVVMGSRHNIKITSPEDLAFAEALVLGLRHSRAAQEGTLPHA